MFLRVLGLLVGLLPAALAQFAVFPDAEYFEQQWTKAPLAVELDPIASLGDFVSDGELELSLRAYLELVMANNPDVNLQKLAVYEQQNAIERALSPFDPIAAAAFDATRSETPSQDVLAGADVRSTLVQAGRATYDQTFDTGTNFQVQYVTNRRSDNSSFATFNPALTQSLQVALSQPLLRGRGRQIQRIPFFIAESRLYQTQAQVRDQVMTLLFQAENDYWDAISAREQLGVQENNLELARAFLERSRRELELGAISPLDIYQPEQQFATAQVQVTQARYRLQQALDAVRRQIGADLYPDFRGLPLDLTEPIQPSDYMPEMEAEAVVAEALRRRPEIEGQRRSIEVDDLQIRGATNRLRPDVAINAFYSATGRGGPFFDRSIVDGGAGVVIPGGLGDALNQLFGFQFPTYSVGLSIELPLRNRQAAADLSDAVIQKRRDLYQLRSIEQEIRLDVLQAIAGVELSKASVQQATVARDFAQKRLEAEQRKYDLGVSTAFIVLDAQDDLVSSEADLLAQGIAYRRSLITLYLATGELLERRDVALRYD